MVDGFGGVVLDVLSKFGQEIVNIVFGNQGNLSSSSVSLVRERLFVTASP